MTGRTLAENLAELRPPAPDGTIIAPMKRPIHATGGLAILKGSLAPEGAVIKAASIDQTGLRRYRQGVRRREGRHGGGDPRARSRQGMSS